MRLEPIDTRIPLPPPEELPHPERGAFGRVLCGIDASRSSVEAARQAAVLAGPDGSLELVSVATVRGTGLGRQSALSPQRALDALRRTAKMAREIGPTVSTRLFGESDPVEVLRSAGEKHDLTVVASHGGSRAAGIVLGRTASALIHAPRFPVLLVRRPPGGPDFPASIVTASDARPDSERALELTARIARVYGSRVTLVVALWDLGSRDPTAAVEATRQRLVDAGVEPTTHAPAMDPHAAILDAARTANASLVVLGSHRLTGLRALGSVSETVAHELPCSVLVAPG